MIRVFVIPEMRAQRALWPCATIRLFFPLTKNVMADALNVSFGTADDLAFQNADVVIAQRISLQRIEDVERVKKYCKLNGAKFVYDIDDDFLAMESDHSQAAGFERFKPIVRRALESAHQVWVSTQTLADRYRGFARDVVVFPNELDQRAWRPNRPPRRQGQQVRFLYMGSTTHRRDLAELVLPAFARVRDELYEDVSLTLIGVSVQKHPGIEYATVEVPEHVAPSYPAFANWLQSLEPYDAGLAPLLDTAFNRAKSDIKQLEYAALGLPTIASDLPPYRDSPCCGQTTVLAKSSDAFYRAMRDLVLDAHRRHELQSRACDIAAESIAGSQRQEPRLQSICALVGKGA